MTDITFDSIRTQFSDTVYSGGFTYSDFINSSGVSTDWGQILYANNIDTLTPRILEEINNYLNNREKIIEKIYKILENIA